MSDSVRPHRRQPTRLPHPGDSPGKNTGVGCHVLLQGVKVKSESEVAQSCPTLSDPMDCSPPGSSIHWIFQARVLEWDAIAFSVKYIYHYIKQITNKDLLYSIGNYTQYLVIIYNGRECKKDLNHFAVHLNIVSQLYFNKNKKKTNSGILIKFLFK